MVPWRDRIAAPPIVRPRRRPITFAVFSALLFTLFAGHASLPAQQSRNICDKDLEELARGPHGYRLRDGRCEGVFAQQVGGTPLFVVSFTQYFSYDQIYPDDSLLVEWRVPTRGEVRLRAEGISPGLHYRMDAMQAPGSEDFSWPSDILAARDIDQADIGVIAWMILPVAGRDRRVLLPLSVRKKGTTADCASSSLTVWTGPRLSEVFVTVAPVEVDGRTGTAIWDAQPLGWRYYPAESPIAIPLPELTSAGVYYISVVGERRGGGSSLVEAWIYHSAAARTGCAG